MFDSISKKFSGKLVLYTGTKGAVELRYLEDSIESFWALGVPLYVISFNLCR